MRPLSSPHPPFALPLPPPATLAPPPPPPLACLRRHSHSSSVPELLEPWASSPEAPPPPPPSRLFRRVLLGLLPAMGALLPLPRRWQFRATVIMREHITSDRPYTYVAVPMARGAVRNNKLVMSATSRGMPSCPVPLCWAILLPPFPPCEPLSLCGLLMFPAAIGSRRPPCIPQSPDTLPHRCPSPEYPRSGSASNVRMRARTAQLHATCPAILMARKCQGSGPSRQKFSA